MSKPQEKLTAAHTDTAYVPTPVIRWTLALAFAATVIILTWEPAANVSVAEIHVSILEVFMIMGSCTLLLHVWEFLEKCAEFVNFIETK